MNKQRQLKWLIVRWGHRVLVLWWWLTRPTTEGVKVVVLHNKRVLLVRLSYGHQRWVFPGGGVHKGESTKAAAIREVQEETGILLRSDNLEFLTQYTQQIEYKSDTVTCFIATADNPRITANNWEILEAAWFSVSDLPAQRAENVDKIVSLLNI